MSGAKVLHVSHEIEPYSPSTEMAYLCRHLPQKIHETGKEIRVFMPRFGNINERRHQLHEVIRLSGMNLIINDADHPLIIKVASIPIARMQVYFIDNEEYFKRKAKFRNEKNTFFEDNDERMVFFCRGVLETVKKLGWKPDIIHCHGWMSALMPLIIKKRYTNDPHFNESKIIYSAYTDHFSETLDKDLLKKLKFEGIEPEDAPLMKNPTYENLLKTAAQYSDAFILGEESIPAETEGILRAYDKRLLAHPSDEDYASVYNEFYDEILEGNSVLAG